MNEELDFKVIARKYGQDGPKALTDEELVYVYPKAVQAAKLFPDNISSVGFADDIKEELLKRMKWNPFTIRR